MSANAGGNSPDNQPKQPGRIERMLTLLVPALLGGGIGALATAYVSIATVHNTERDASREFSTSFAPDADESIEQRLRNAEYWSMISSEKAERTRWGKYAIHLKGIQDDLSAKQAARELALAVVAKAETATKEQLAALASAEAALNESTVRTEAKRAESNASVYLHIASEDLRFNATMLSHMVRGLGAVAHGIENMEGRAKFNGNELRYFREDDKEDAAMLVAYMAARGYELKLQHVGGYTKPPRYVEIWLQTPIGPPSMHYRRD